MRQTHDHSTEDRVTPMMAQYIEIKGANPDCLLFYRMGDFYELFFEDAEIASRALGIVLTKRGKHQGADIPMCGVPVERADDYLQRLIAAGHRVAVCEQLEDPAEAKKRGAKSVVRRDVTRRVTPGTITEERLLDPGEANRLLAVARQRADDQGWIYGIAAADISTGHFVTIESQETALLATIARFAPREILLPDSLLDDQGPFGSLLRDRRNAITPMAREGFDASSAEKRLEVYFDVATLSGFGTFSRAELVAAAALVTYVERTQKGIRAPLAPPSRESHDSVMRIDAATRANLEITRTLSGERHGSLLASIDRTVTPVGARLLAERLAGPLTDLAEIRGRHDAIAYCLDRRDLRQTLRKALKSAPDMLRALTRVAMDRGGPRDLVSLGIALLTVKEIAAKLPSDHALPQEIEDARKALLRVNPELPSLLNAALAEDVPLNKRDGGFIRQGFSKELDDIRALRDESRKVIAKLQADYIALTGARALRIKFNNFLGYFIEVPQANGEEFLKPPHVETFIHRQTMQGAMRFSTAELAELAGKIVSAGDRALALELDLFSMLATRLIESTEAIRHAADALAIIDVATALAELADDLNHTRPVMTDELEFIIEGGRHPVVEQALRRSGVSFVANKSDLSQPEHEKGGRILVVTGPNMAGKSTYLRQNALIAIMAQAGCFVPAKNARIGRVDRLFSRVGAADDLARGRSTFMVEMIETAAILNQATPQSLVILDEIGRGTATFDGLSIAWATIEHLHEVNRCRALFATHFHELIALTQKLPRLKNATMRVTDHKGEVIFLHEVIAGAADRSYGIHVARLAGLPRSVVDRASMILAELEASDRHSSVDVMLDELPLFSTMVKQSSSRIVSGPDPLHEALESIHPDDLTPKDALEALYNLKSLQRNHS
ncbi:MAG: DNA mismatch repair protein MutS [Alphaproteobacteria bacterium]|nr:DNA mismatch repair protein MutS [Alphaproteobacteria bacterium]